MNIKRLSRPYRWGALVLLSSAALNAMADCGEILESGLRNTYSLTQAGNFKNSFSNNFCSSNLQKGTNSAGGNADVALKIPGVGPIGFGGGYNEKQAKELQNSACGGGTGALSNEQYLNVLQRIADPNIVRAWSECNKTAGGLLLNGELLDATNIEVSLEFRNAAAIHQATLTGKPGVIGATCPNMTWDKGTLITGSRQYVQCTRQGNSPVSFIVNSDYNGARFYLPQPQTITIAGPISQNDDIPPPPPPAPQPTHDDGYTVDALICVPSNAGPGPTFPNTMPRCPAACNATVGSACSCKSPGFSGRVAKISISGVLRAPGQPPTGSDCP
ncbi:hypothetical protein [Pseudomonas yamanorum]|uniref:hypothetical protein n=1 Tax=Pseudomonas yamanorum TaxID=515393 RepID=UPI00087C8C12|nr:hypothetical protein [Pseudomonas yamanorum]SDT99214.1 hypothetical protein SAMN05216237_1147 [Pseudomonas yamanorum]